LKSILSLKGRGGQNKKGKETEPKEKNKKY